MNPSDNLQNKPYGAQPSQIPSEGQSNSSGDGQSLAKPVHLNGEPYVIQGANNAPEQVVYMARPLEPIKQQISLETQQKHAASCIQYPQLHLSNNEYVISAVKRHPIGLINAWTVVAIVIIILVGGALLLAGHTGTDSTLSQNGGGLGSGSLPLAVLLVPVILLSGLALLFGAITTKVYNANRFYLTNESVIQHIQTSLFAKKEQTISLENIEDASYTQNGIFPEMLGYGNIRLSTPGNETTYRFSNASDPQKQIALLNDAVEAFKNGRPVGDS